MEQAIYKAAKIIVFVLAGVLIFIVLSMAGL